jgi:protein SCO1
MPPKSLAICLLLALIFGSACSEKPQPETEAITVPELRDFGGLGGDFSLSDHEGQPFNLEQIKGRTALLFFGYTFCPDICPTTLSKLSQVYSQLGVGPDSLVTLFVSVDPQRDTPKVLKDYIGHFGIDAVGLTGTKEEIDAVVQAYGAQYSFAEAESANKNDYLVNHSTYTYLIDTEGRVRFLFRRADAPQTMAAVVRRLFGEGQQARAQRPAALPGLLAEAPAGCGLGLLSGQEYGGRSSWFVIGESEPLGTRDGDAAALQPEFHLGLGSAGTGP